MGPLGVVCDNPGVAIGLQRLDRPVDLLAGGRAAELVAAGAMETLADAAGPRAFGLVRAGSMSATAREFLFVALAAELGAAIAQPAVRPHPRSPRNGTARWFTPMPGAGAVHLIDGRFHDQCLDEEGFTSLDEARTMIERWRQDYNQVRPHSRIGRLGRVPWSGAGAVGKRRSS